MTSAGRSAGAERIERAPAASGWQDDTTLELRDEDIVCAVQIVDAAQVAQGQLATARAEDNDIRQYAANLASEHRSARAVLGALARRKHLVARPNDVSRRLQRDSEAALAVLNGASGAELDRVYLKIQVELHERWLSLLTRQWLVHARDDELRELLMDRRRHAEDHLEIARELLESLE